MDNKDKEVIGKNKKLNKKIINVFLIVILFLSTAVGFFYLGNKTSLTSYAFANKDLSKSMDGVKDVSKFKQLFKVRDLIYKYYDGEIDNDKLVDGAIKGMTQALKDPYTIYMDSNEYKKFSEKVEGNYVGIGIQIQVKDDKITVAKPLEGSPAQKLDVKPGDVILKVDNTDVSGKELEKAMSMIRGKEGTNVKLTLFREGKGDFNLDVPRKRIKNQSIYGNMIGDNIGYIEIKEFTHNTGKDFTSKLKDLENKGMKGLILDLRNNPGGYLTESVNVVSNFIPKDKTIVSTINKYGEKSVNESKGGVAIGMPLVVLTNGETASASEIVAGAIKDYGIGTLIGEKTFGKGVVQAVIEDKQNGSALKVTISKYYTPNGENINKIGIKPEIEVTYPEDLLSKPYSRQEDPQFQKALEVMKEKMK